MTSKVKNRVIAFVQLLTLALAAVAQHPTAQVYRMENGEMYFGKMYVPKGGKYKLERHPKDGTTVNLYYGNLDNTKIYVNLMVVIEDCYWIDATETAHAFIVSSTTADDVVMVPVTEAEDAMINDTPEYFYYNLALSRQNRFKYTEEAVTNETLCNSSLFANKYIYVMGDLAIDGITFDLLDKSDASMPDLPAGSLYVLGQKRADNLRVILEEMEDVDNGDGIRQIKNADSQSSNAKSQMSNAIYDLSGRKVSVNSVFSASSVLPKGVYIRNGKLFLRK